METLIFYYAGVCTTVKLTKWFILNVHLLYIAYINEVGKMYAFEIRRCEILLKLVGSELRSHAHTRTTPAPVRPMVPPACSLTHQADDGPWWGTCRACPLGVRLVPETECRTRGIQRELLLTVCTSLRVDWGRVCVFVFN